MTIGRWHARLLALVACVLFIACSGGATDPTPTAAPAALPSVEQEAGPGAYGVGVTTLNLVDPTRPTAPNREAPGAPQRELPVEVWYPIVKTADAAPEQRDALLDPSAGPYPLLIFAHGLSSSRLLSASYTRHLASHGYIVAAPDFPLSRLGTPGGARIAAALEQPTDVSFVIDEMLARNVAADSVFSGAIDEGRIGMTGHSLGGLTAMLATFGAMRDDRIKAMLAIAPFGCVLPDGFAEGESVPAMVIGGSKDLIVGPASMHHAYDIIAAPKYFVQIIGADHTRFSDVDIRDDQIRGIVSEIGRGDVVSDVTDVIEALGADAATCLQEQSFDDEAVSGERQRELLRAVATPFFDAYLRGDPGAMRFLQETLPSLPGTRVESDTGP